MVVDCGGIKGADDGDNVLLSTIARRDRSNEDARASICTVEVRPNRLHCPGVVAVVWLDWLIWFEPVGTVEALP